METKKHGKTTYTAITAFLSVFVMYITFFFVQEELKNVTGDYAGHLYEYLPLLSGESFLKGWMAVPYCMWHLLVKLVYATPAIPLEAAAGYVSAAFAGFSFYVTYYFLSRIAKSENLEANAVKISLLTFALSIVEPVCVYWFSAQNQYLGQFSINPMHNPTHMCVKPFCILAMMLVYDLWEKIDDDEYKGVFFDVSEGTKKAFIGLSVVLLLSTFAKPTFAEMFIPTVAFMMLFLWIKKLVSKDGSAKEYFGNCLYMLYAALPALLFILIQALAYFAWGGSYGVESTKVEITSFLEVWKMFSDNIIASVFMGIGFPLIMLLVDGYFFKTNRLGQMSVWGYVIGFIEAALLGEATKLGHGDFLWPLMSGMTLIWYVCVARLMVVDEREAAAKWINVLRQVAWCVFSLFVLFGALYIYRQIF